MTHSKPFPITPASFIIYAILFVCFPMISSAENASPTVAAATCTEKIASWTPDPAVTAELASSPRLLKQKLEEAMRLVVKDPKILDITLVEFDTASTSHGHLKQVMVKTEGGEIDGLILHKASFDFQDVQLDTTKLVREAKIDTISVCNIDMDVIITESDLNTFLGEKARKIKVDNPKVELATGQLILSGSTKYSFVKVSFWATGYFDVKDSKQIWFHSKRLKLNSMTMPRAFVGNIIKRINPVLNLEKFPFRLNLREIRIEDGALHFISNRQGN